MSVFNARGELNAGSLQDALAQIAKFASVLQENQPSNLNLAGQPGLSETQRDELLSRAVMTQDGKVALAQAMANPI